MYFVIDEKNRVVTRVVDEFAGNLVCDNRTVFRVDAIPATEPGEILCYNAETSTFYTEKVVVDEEQRKQVMEKIAARRQKEKALEWLAENDWKVNKRFLGEWTEADERWIAYLEERANVRTEIDAADEILNA